ncbi:MAG: cysteine--tRNA ligase [Bacteroides sp.]|nr:MAG: cysteine--tRNA ligase [Bacteroides sp.]
MRNLYIYNTMSRKKEKFIPGNNKYVKMYVCGPTVYNHAHIGHARSAIFFDVIYRYLQHLNYKVYYVRNITDIQNYNISSKNGIYNNIFTNHAEWSQYHINQYHNILYKLNVIPPSIEPYASGHIVDQIEMIKLIIKNGYAYIKNNSVYFNIQKYNQKFIYGNLSKRDIKNYVLSNYKNKEKINNLDFVLWKNDNNSELKWNSPWGLGLPGWHTECAAMSIKYLGCNFDIHGGGNDLIFPHHEASISQVKSCYNNNLAKYWIHHNMVVINGTKMSKSLNNSVFIKDILCNNKIFQKKSYNAMSIRLFILKNHYRNIIHFSDQNIQQSYQELKKLIITYNIIKNLCPSNKSTLNFDQVIDQCYNAINDDFNIPLLINILFKISKMIHSIQNKENCINDIDLEKIQKTYFTFLHDILGISLNIFNENINDFIDLIINIRSEIRSHHNYKYSDFIREKIKKLGIEILDSKNDSKWNLI